MIGTVLNAVSAGLNAAVIGGTEGAVATITVKHALLFAGGVRTAADLMRGSSRGGPGGWGGINQPVAGPGIQDGGFSSPMFAMAAGAAECEVCPTSGLEFLKALFLAREVAAAELPKGSKDGPARVDDSADKPGSKPDNPIVYSVVTRRLDKRAQINLR